MPDERSFVKNSGRLARANAAILADYRDMPRQKPKHIAPSPVAARIRARIGELGTTESDVSEGLGHNRRQLSSQLRRLDNEEGNLRSDTLQELSLALGKSVQWILTGEESSTPLSRDPRWPEAAAEAAARGLSAEAIARVGTWCPPAPPERIDASLILLLSSVPVRAA